MEQKGGDGLAGGKLAEGRDRDKSVLRATAGAGGGRRQECTTIRRAIQWKR